MGSRLHLFVIRPGHRRLFEYEMCVGPTETEVIDTGKALVPWPWALADGDLYAVALSLIQHIQDRSYIPSNAIWRMGWLRLVS